MAIQGCITRLLLPIHRAHWRGKALGQQEEWAEVEREWLKSIGSLESLMTLLKVARQNKMICICDGTQDIQLE